MIDDDNNDMIVNNKNNNNNNNKKKMVAKVQLPFHSNETKLWNGHQTAACLMYRVD